MVARRRQAGLDPQDWRNNTVDGSLASSLNQQGKVIKAQHFLTPNRATKCSQVNSFFSWEKNGRPSANVSELDTISRAKQPGVNQQNQARQSALPHWPPHACTVEIH